MLQEQETAVELPGDGITRSAQVRAPAPNYEPAKASWLQRAWCSLADQMRSLFFSNVRVDQAEDTLVEVVRGNPSRASSLLQSVAAFSIAGNMLSAILCVSFLVPNWSACGQCSRPLRWWLLLQSLFQMSQLPVRVVLLFCLKRSEARLEDAIASLTSSLAWSLSKKVALLQYGWFVLGIVWVMHTDTCPNCPAISRLTGAVMMLSVLRVVAAICVFKFCFPGNQPGNDAQQANPVVGATSRQIRSIPAHKYEEPLSNNDDQECTQGSCSICLSDFTSGVLLRRLPCGHHFHRSCVDKWLARNKRCPLCMHAIDEVCNWAPKKRPSHMHKRGEACHLRKFHAQPDEG